MKRIACIVALLFAASYALAAHQVTLNWTPSTDTGGTVKVYRFPGPCSTAASFVVLASNIPPAGPYVDPTVGIGTFCYYVTVTINGAESNPSNQVQANILPAAPTALGTTPSGTGMLSPPYVIHGNELSEYDSGGSVLHATVDGPK
jgi:hypothetical protein